MFKYIILVIVFSIITKTEAARILAIFPVPSISHQFFFRPLIHELVKKGHDVVVITTHPAFPPGEAPENLTEIDVHNESYYTWQNNFVPSEIGKENDIIKQCKVFLESFVNMTENQLKTKLVQNIIRNENNETFDLLIVETCMRSSLAFTHIYKAPVISITSTGPVNDIYEIMGVPSHPLLYPTIIHQRLYNLTYWEKIKELYRHYYLDYVYKSFEEKEMIMLKKYFGPDLPSYKELYNRINLYFQNSHPVLSDNVPVPPNVVFLGGLHQKPEQPLPKELSSFMNNSKNGVIYVSFGTNVKISLLPLEKVRMMKKTFSKLPYEVLWKVDTLDLPDTPANVKISQWFPQADLLRHPKVKAFVTQGGLQSTDEAITAGVPLIGIPIYGDQLYNVEKYVRHRIGLQLDWKYLTEEELTNAIFKVTEDSSYRENIIRLRTIVNDQPQTSLERGIWWIEYVLRHNGAPHLRAPAANMSWAEYYELNILLILVISLTTVSISFLSFVYFIWLKICSKYFVSGIKIKKC